MFGREIFFFLRFFRSGYGGGLRAKSVSVSEDIFGNRACSITDSGH